MTPEQEARALLAEIAETQDWMRGECSNSSHKTAYVVPCWECRGKDWLPLADLEVAAWRAWVHISEHKGIWQLVKLNERWEVWNHGLDGGEVVATHQEPKCAVFTAALELSKEQADAE